MFLLPATPQALPSGPTSILTSLPGIFVQEVPSPFNLKISSSSFTTQTAPPPAPTSIAPPGIYLKTGSQSSTGSYTGPVRSSLVGPVGSSPLGPVGVSGSVLSTGSTVSGSVLQGPP